LLPSPAPTLRSAVNHLPCPAKISLRYGSYERLRVEASSQRCCTIACMARAHHCTDLCFTELLSAQAEFDAFAFGDVNSWRLQYLHRRAKIVEIVACQGLIFSLAQSGACAAFDRGALL